MPGESEFIDWVRSLASSSVDLIIPPGDDLAAMKWRDDLLIAGADQVLDGVHFETSRHSPAEIGRKAMNRNLSDCAAMACLPAAAVVTVALPRGTRSDYARELYLGLKKAADAFETPIVGGDTGTWEGKLALSVTILGRAGGIQPVRRSDAQPGDRIYVTGRLGGSILGRHMTFHPQVKLARELASGSTVSAMIDISDGLSRDLAHICRESGVGAVVQAERIPIHADAESVSQRDGRPALEHALHDGEDYELLLTSPAELPSHHLFTIGVVTAEPGLFLQHADGRREPLEPRGWEHRF